MKLRWYRWMAVTGLALAHTPIGAADANKACALTTPSELEAVLGGKVTLSGGGKMPGKDVEMCNGQSPAASVMLRLFKRTGDPSGAAEKAGIDAIRKMGAKVEVKTFGQITCTLTIPPPNLAHYGYNTTCSVNKAPMFAVIEVATKSEKDMVPMERLRGVAEKMGSRF